MTMSARLAAAGVASAAILAPTLAAAPAHAAPPPCSPKTGCPAPPNGPNAPREGPWNGAPTQNLYRMASAVRVSSYSATAYVKVASGLPLDPANRMEVSVLFGEPGFDRPGKRVTQAYDNAAGNQMRYGFPALDGAERREKLTISLLEATPNGNKAYSFAVLVNLKPRYEITLSPLYFNEIGKCDTGSLPDPKFYWTSPDGVYHQKEVGTAYNVDTGRGGAALRNFAGKWRTHSDQTGKPTGLRSPNVYWRELDPTLQITFNPAPGLGSPVLPGATRTVTWIEKEVGGDCSARLSYEIVYQLLTPGPILPPILP